VISERDALDPVIERLSTTCACDACERYRRWFTDPKRVAVLVAESLVRRRRG
jgi:hypothetical protein